MTDFENLVAKSIKNISLQIEGLTHDKINQDMIIVGEGSSFDSLGILILLVDLEENISHKILQGRSLVDWFSQMEFTDDVKINLEQFTSRLFVDYLKV